MIRTAKKDIVIIESNLKDKIKLKEETSNATMKIACEIVKLEQI